MDRLTRSDALLGGGALSLALLARGASADEPTAPEKFGAYTLANCERFVLASKHVGDRFQIDVAWPLKPASDERYRVCYVLDALPWFASAVQIGRAMADMDIAAPVEQLIFVGIGYPGADDARTMVLRRRDFTQPGWSWVSRADSKGQPISAEGTGGAEPFLRFLEDELDPVIRARYACAPGKAGLLTASLGGNFALYALFCRSRVLAGYSISSPGVVNEDDPIFALEESCRASGETLDATVLLTLGELEETLPSNYQHLARCYRKLIAILEQRKYRGLNWSSEVLPRESHVSAIPLTIARGLRKLYGLPPRLG